MKLTFAAAGLAVGASAAIIPRQQCCFSLVSSGQASGDVTQLSDGQNRIANGTSGNSASATSSSAATATTPASYCISNGAITDAQGRGCIVTGPTTQFQCDSGAAPQSGFSVTSNGDLSFEGSSVFYACAASDQEDNIYIHTSSAVTNCHQISLNTNGKCVGSSPGSSSAAGSAVPSSSSIGVSTPAQSSTASRPVVTPSSASRMSTESVQGTSTASHASSVSISSEQAPTTFSTRPAESTSQISQSPVGSASQPATTPAVTINSQSTSSSAYAPSGSASVASPGSSSAQTPASSAEGSSTVWTFQSSFPFPSRSTLAPSLGTSVQVSTLSSSQVESSAIRPSSSVQTLSASASAPTSVASLHSSGTVTTSTFASQTPGRSSTQPTQPSTVQATTHSTVATPATSASHSAPTSGAATTPSVQSSQAASTSGSPTASGSACQTSLTGAYQTPHLIVPVSSTSPNTAYGTSYNGQINSTTSTIFNFDIPQSYAGNQCSIIFLFPQQSQLQTSSYTFSGSGSIDFAQLSSAATQQTTWSNVPSVQTQLNTIAIQPGNTYVVATQSCQAGTTESIELSSVGGLNLNFFEDWNPASLGLYITSC